MPVLGQLEGKALTGSPGPAESAVMAPRLRSWRAIVLDTRGVCSLDATTAVSMPLTHARSMAPVSPKW